MDYGQFITMLVAFAGMFFWSRSEARHDQSEMRLILKAIQDEMKDFHARLCVIEERKKKDV